MKDHNIRQLWRSIYVALTVYVLPLPSILQGEKTSKDLSKRIGVINTFAGINAFWFVTFRFKLTILSTSLKNRPLGLKEGHP